MDETKELSKIQELLRIPISDIKFNEKNVSIFSDGNLVGKLPFFTISGENEYDNTPNVVNWFDWFAIYTANKAEINSKIVELLETSDIIIGLGVFRTLYVKDTELTPIGFVRCSYNGSEWEVSNINQ
jgi:hypothetical protein